MLPWSTESDSLSAVPRSFDFSIESPLSVEQIHSAFSEEDYWQARLAAGGGIAKLDSLLVDADGSVSVIVVQDLRHEGAHALVAKFLPRTWQIVHKETWSPIGEDQVRGEVSVAARGAPGSGLGRILLAPAQNGSHLKGTATVEFKVPLIGGKVEGMIGRQLVEGISTLLSFTDDWISEHA